NQDIDFPELTDCRLETGLDLLFIGNIHGKSCSVSAHRVNLGYNFVQLLAIASSQGNDCPRVRQFERARLPNPLRSAAYQRHVPGEGHRFLLMAENRNYNWTGATIVVSSCSRISLRKRKRTKGGASKVVTAVMNITMA